MKNQMSDLYFCHGAKQIVRDLSELYFVEENSTNGFCSENCIESFINLWLITLKHINSQFLMN